MESNFVYNKRYFFQKIKIVMSFVSTKNLLGFISKRALLVDKTLNFNPSNASCSSSTLLRAINLN